MSIADLLVADHLARAYPRPTARRIALSSVPNKADVLIGMRRSGKTWRVYQHLHELLASGVPREATLYVSLEDDRIAPVELGFLDALLSAFERVAPDLPTQRWLMLDEIQVVPGWERFVRRVIDQDLARVVLTGSSAALLSRELSSALRGRSLATEVLPFSFIESLLHRGTEPPAGEPGGRLRARLEHELDRYLTVGGFPEVQALEDGIRRRVLQEYVDVVILRDVIERHGVSNVPALRHLVRRLLRSPGAKLSVHRIHAELRGAGVRVGKDALHELLAHLEDAFMVFAVPVDTRSEKRRAVNPRKFYLVDPGLAWASSFDTAADVGHRLENATYLHLRRQGATVTYHVGDGAHEVDFVARYDDGRVEWIQVAASLADATTRERVLRAFESMPVSKLHRAILVTRLEAARVTHARRTIEVVPAWRWLLGLADPAAPGPGGRVPKASHERIGRRPRPTPRRR